MILIATGAIILSSVVFSVFLDPFFSKNEELDRQIKVTRLKLEKYLNLLDRKEELGKKYEKYASFSGQAAEVQDALVSALAELEGLTKESGIHIIDIRPEAAPKKTGALKEVIIELKSEGALEGLLRFVYGLENSPSLLRIKKLQVDAKSGSTDLEARFTISQTNLSE